LEFPNILLEAGTQGPKGLRVFSQKVMKLEERHVWVRGVAKVVMCVSGKGTLALTSVSSSEAAVLRRTMTLV